MISSTLTVKGQATIPAEIRKALDLKPGDKIVFEISDHQAVIKKLTPFDYQYHASLSETLNEWGTAEDEEAYGNL